MSGCRDRTSAIDFNCIFNTLRLVAICLLLFDGISMNGWSGKRSIFSAFVLIKARLKTTRFNKAFNGESLWRRKALFWFWIYPNKIICSDIRTSRNTRAIHRIPTSSLFSLSSTSKVRNSTQAGVHVLERVEENEKEKAFGFPSFVSVLV